jgi:hypothetical protein
MSGRGLFGIIAVFGSADALVNAATRVRELGFGVVDAYTPYPIEGLGETLRPGRQILLPALIVIGAIVGAFWGYFIQYWGEASDYPLNVGGRPYNSWPAFTVGAFEVMLLFAVAAGFVGLLVKCGLPLLYHPVLEAERFSEVSRDRFVLCVEARDPNFEAASLHRTFEELGAEHIEMVAGWS